MNSLYSSIHVRVIFKVVWQLQGYQNINSLHTNKHLYMHWNYM